VLGFAIGEALCAYTLYLTSHGLIGNETLFLGLCPPSIGALGLDKAGTVGGIVGWQFIAAANALLYSAVAAVGVLVFERT
jgi:hypothetical protein